MTVCFLHRMQEPLDFKSKPNAPKMQRPMKRTMFGSDTSMSCVPANQQPPSGPGIDAAATKQAIIQNESIDCTEYSSVDPKQLCEVDPTASAGETDPDSQRSYPNDSRCTSDLSTIPSGVRTPPPSAVSTSTHLTPEGASVMYMCLPADKICIQISDNVPIPSKTDIIARISREALSQNAEDEDSDVYASGEEWEDDKKSEYSTADEDFEPLYQKMVEKKAQIAKQPDINESETNTEDGNSEDVTESARTDANVERDLRGPAFAVGTNSEALRPVLVRQVSQDEDVRVISEDDENDRLVQIPYVFGKDLDDDQRDEPIMPRHYIYCERLEVPHSLHDSATSPIPPDITRQDQCDDATEPVRWSEVLSRRSDVTADEPERTPDGYVDPTSPGLARKESKGNADSRSSGRWRSMPILPIEEPFENPSVACVPVDSQMLQQPTQMYPMLHRAERHSETVPSTTHRPEIMGRRATQAMVEALAVCEQELGPLAVSLAELQDKVRKLNLPDINTEYRRPMSTPACDPSTNIIRQARAQRMSAPVPPSASSCPRPQHHFGGSWSEPMSRTSHDVDCLCRYCGVQNGVNANLSPMARIYIVMAQPRRISCERNDGNGRPGERRP